MAEVLSIVMPVYNEARTITTILDKIRQVELPAGITRELIIVNDCSTDHTEETILAYQKQYPQLPIRYLKNDRNRGKGYSLRQGIQAATGAYTIIQDADLEYDPRDYPKLLQPVLEGHADVVYGSRLHSSAPHRILFSGTRSETTFSPFCRTWQRI